MADSLADMQNTAQGNTLGDIQNTTGAAPTSIGTAQSLGAAQNASQMVGTPQQQKAAIKEAIGPQNTLAELQRTAAGRVQTKAGQSATALEAAEAAKAFAGIAGKIGEATTKAVAGAGLALDVRANLDSITGKTPEEKATLANDLTALTDALNNKGDTMTAYKQLKSKYNMDANQIASLFNITPDQLWGKVESQLPPNVKVKDLDGLTTPEQMTALQRAIPQDKLDKLSDMSWSDAKGYINKYLSDSAANVDELKKQASDRTLPPSVRSAALQRMRELGVSGELQAAEELNTAQNIIDNADNVYIGGQAYEAADVLKSPEAKSLISDILLGNKDIKALDGTPFASLKGMLAANFDKLADHFGIDKGQIKNAGTLQQLENTRASNKLAIDNWLGQQGLTGVPTTSNVLKAFGITEDAINGYASFDNKSVANPTLTTVLSLPQADRAAAFEVLNRDGADTLLNVDTNKDLVGLLKTQEGRETLGGLISVSKHMSDFTSNDKDDTAQLFTELGLNGLFDDVKSLAGANVSEFGGKIPDLLDVNKDGKIDDATTIESSLAGADMAKLNEFKNAVQGANLGQAVQNYGNYKTFVTDANALLSTPGSESYLTVTNENSMQRKLAELKASEVLRFNEQTGEPMLSQNPSKLEREAADTFNKLNQRLNSIKSVRDADTALRTRMESTPPLSANNAGEVIYGKFHDALRAAQSAVDPKLKQEALDKMKYWFETGQAWANSGNMSKAQRGVWASNAATASNILNEYVGNKAPAPSPAPSTQPASTGTSRLGVRIKR